MSWSHLPSNSTSSHERALRDFVRARNQASMQELTARLRGESNELLSWNEVCRHLADPSRMEHKGVTEIPLAAIVGSVGRYKDFTRDFLPRTDSDRERWARVRASLEDTKGWSPIEVYQVGEVYFVVDGNHRVSVARQIGQKTITALVTVVPTRVAISADDDPDDIIAKARYAEFLSLTRLDQLRPDANLYLTFHSRYELLLAGITTWSELVNAAEPFAPEAVSGWYDHVYLPVIRLIRRLHTARHFPGHSEADLFVLVTGEREEIGRQLGWSVDPASAAASLRERKSGPSWWRRIGRYLRPAELEDGPLPGSWREENLPAHPDRLFADILVSLEDTPEDWRLLERALRIALLDGSRLLGVWVSDTSQSCASEEALAVEERFLEQVAAAGVQGGFARVTGSVDDVLIARARHADLIVTNLTGPYRHSLLGLTSGPERLIQQSPRPLLLWPDQRESALSRALLAYDGSPKANEALFLATYLALRWHVALDVVTVVTDHTPAETIEQARAYISGEHGLEARFVVRDRPIAPAILDTAAELGSDWLIMGGFGFSPVRYLLLGSAVSQIIPDAPMPILVCR
jgi:nucleotide-binding universal stress UspA family protein